MAELSLWKKQEIDKMQFELEQHSKLKQQGWSTLYLKFPTPE